MFFVYSASMKSYFFGMLNVISCFWSTSEKPSAIDTRVIFTVLKSVENVIQKTNIPMHA